MGTQVHYEIQQLPLDACVTPLFNDRFVVTFSVVTQNIVLLLKSNRPRNLAAFRISRKHHAAVLFEGKLTILGGVWNGQLLSSVEEYDFNEDCWKTRANMPVPAENCAVCEHTRCLYVYSGGAFIQKRAQDVWAELTITPVPGHFFSLASVGDHLFIFGDAKVYARLSGISSEQFSCPWKINRCASSPVVAGNRILLLAQNSIVGFGVEASSLIPLKQPLIGVDQPPHY